MKIKALAALCGKAKSLVLYDDENRQWAGDGVAAYLLPEALGTLSMNGLTTVFDIPSDKAADLFMRRSDMPAGYDTADDAEDDEEELSFDTDSRILHRGKDLIPCAAPDGKIYLIQNKYIKPLADSDGLRLTLRRMSESRRPYITAKDGMFLAAIISPMTVGDELCLWLQSMTTGAAKTRTWEREAEHEDA